VCFVLPRERASRSSSRLMRRLQPSSRTSQYFPLQNFLKLHPYTKSSIFFGTTLCSLVNVFHRNTWCCTQKDRTLHSHRRENLISSINTVCSSHKARDIFSHQYKPINKFIMLVFFNLSVIIQRRGTQKTLSRIVPTISSSLSTLNSIPTVAPKNQFRNIFEGFIRYFISVILSTL
jgi:hypothetical protein